MHNVSSSCANCSVNKSKGLLSTHIIGNTYDYISETRTQQGARIANVQRGDTTRVASGYTYRNVLA